MKFSLDILFVLIKDFLSSQGETETASKIAALMETSEKDLLEVRKAVKFTDLLKCFFKHNPEKKKLIEKKTEEIYKKMQQAEEDSDPDDSDEEEEEPVVEEKKPQAKAKSSVSTSNGKTNSTKPSIAAVKKTQEKEEEEETTLLGNKTERKPFQRIDDSIKESLPEVLKNNSYDVRMF